jgi:methyl-accepting chemotaxis protein
MCRCCEGEMTRNKAQPAAAQKKPARSAREATNTAHGGAGFQGVSAVLRALRRMDERTSAARAALDTICSVFGFDHAAYWEVDASAKLRVTLDSGPMSEALRADILPMSFARGTGVNGRAWESSELLLVEDLASVSDCVRSEAAHAAGMQSLVCFPITLWGTVVATMDFGTRERVRAGDARCEALRAVAELVSSTLERIRDQEEQRRHAEDAMAVAAVLEAVSSASNMETAARATLEAVCSAFSWNYGSYFRRDSEADVLHFALESGEIGTEFRRSAREATFRQGAGVHGRAWATGDLVAIHDLGDVADCPRAAAARRSGVKSGVCFAIKAGARVIGTMDFFSTQHEALSDARVRALRSVARLVSAVAERIQLREDFVYSLRRFSSALDGSTTDLTATVNEQTLAAQELAAAVREVSATLGELRASSVETLEQAERVISQADQSADAGSSGAEAVESAINSMRSISHQVGQISERILSLNEQTTQIGDIVASVTEISAQSKLLALNASIESARAGEHGRGFGVVAKEMASLAEQSRAATSQVRQILGQIQAGTNMAVVSAEEGIKKARSGMNLAETSGDNIHTLTRAINESSASARLIANSARQQSAGIRGVADALTAIDNATTSAAAGLRQTRDATHQLMSLSVLMQRLLLEYTQNEPVERSDRDSTPAAHVAE